MVKKWDTIDKKLINNLRIFDVYNLVRQNPEDMKTGNFTVLESLKWVNIIPITSKNNVILIEQYRHGTDEITIEIPGGLVEKDEDPLLAAQRECIEETGYQSKTSPLYLGETSPNPAFLNNRCYSYAWLGCEKIFDQNLDGHEVIDVLEVPFYEVKDMINNRKIHHSLVLNAFLYYYMKFGF